LLGGANLMAETKRIMVNLPNSLVEEVDFIVAMEKKNRSEFVKEAMKLYIREKRKVEVYEQLKDGYVEMSKINLTLAEMGLEQDMVELNVYEAKLTGCEKM
jgi:CopG family transcriptional regulator/antitoxin EndoAI